YFALRFSVKPSEHVRGILKSAGFRWSPCSGQRWRSRVSGAADFLSALRRAIDGVEEVSELARPRPCWVCKSPDGFFRNRGAAAPVWCDACAARIDAGEKAAAIARYRERSDHFDMAVEDTIPDASQP